MEESLRHNRAFVALWVGQAVSSLGIGVSSFAYPLVVLAATGSAVRAGAVGSVLAGTAFVLRLPAGAIVDRVDRRRLMLLCDAGRVVNSAAFAAVLALGHFVFVHVLVVAFVEAALGVLFGPAESAAVRRVVGASRAREAVAANAARSQVPGVVAPPLGGILLAAGRPLPFVADAVSYLVSLVCVLSVRVDLAVERSEPRRLRVELLDGARWIRAHRFLRTLLVLFTASGLSTGGMGLLVLVLARDAGAGAREIGAMFTLTAAGGAAGAIGTPLLLRRVPPFLLVATGFWVAAGATLALPLLGSPLAFGAAGAVALFFVGPLGALAFGTIAAEAPDELQGRATSAAIQIASAGAPVAPLLAGAVVGAVGASTAALCFGCASVVVATAATASRSLRVTRS